MKLSWGLWIYGLVAGLIGGGAGGVVTAISGAVALPQQVNLQAGFHSFLILFYISFAMHGLVSVAFYLQKSPLPQIETTVSVATTEQKGTPTKVVTTVSATTDKQVAPPSN